MGDDFYSDLTKKCLENATVINDSVQGEVKVLQEDDSLWIARETGYHPKEVYVCAMKQGLWPQRYLRNTQSVSLQEQVRMSESGVAVVGAGGLGGFVINFLARLGVGYLLVIDRDVFEPSNLNRQEFAFVNTMNRSKAEVSRESVQNINPGVQVDVVYGDITCESPDWSGVELVVDALDNVRDRFFVERIARELDVPFCHGAVSGFEGRVMTVFPQDRGLALLYGDAGEEQQNEEMFHKPGVPVVSPALVASLQATEVIKILLGRGSDLRERMLYVDLENVYTETFRF